MPLTTTIDSYLYRQYADDDDLQAFVASYNQATQAYVTWFSTAGLPYYPGLTGDLLSWVATGLYGQTKTTLVSPASTALGMLNTEAFNTATLNSFVPSTQTYFTLTEDVFKRILTWNFYKGDGKRFCTRWLKRRVMRFLAGVNGIDPNPTQAGFAVGAENTSAISVHIVGSVLTVNINQILLSSLLQISPGTLTLFQLAFQGGVLDLPVQYTYAVAIQTVLAVSVFPTTESSTGVTASQTTGSAIISATGGSGSYTYAWSWQSGGAGISINTPTAGTTSFTASGLATGAGVSGVAICTVTDTSAGHVASAVIPVTIERSTSPVALVSPSTLSATGASSAFGTSSATVTASGGVGPYTFSWGWQSGGTGIIIASPTSATTSFTGTGLSPSQTESGTALCTVTDHFGQVATVTLPVSIARISAVSASASPASVSLTGASSSETTGGCTITALGGQAPYTYQWNWASGGVNTSIDTPAGATTTFTASGLIPGSVNSGSAQCTVKDVFGQIATVSVPVTIGRATAVVAAVSPSSETSSSVAANQTTGISTVTASNGSGAYTYAWAWASGGAGLIINSPSAAATSFSGNGLVTGSYSGVAQCTVTDGFGQTTSVTVSVSFTRVVNTVVFTNQAATSAIIPNGASQIVIEGWADGGAGGPGSGSIGQSAGGGGGGGAGGYFIKTLSVTSAQWGHTIAISSTLASIASLTVSSGTFSLATLTAHRGGNGIDASLGGAGGAGGTASGGDGNTTGGAGTIGGATHGGAGGVPVTGIHGGPYGAGSLGGTFSGQTVGVGGVAGVVLFYS